MQTKAIKMNTKKLIVKIYLISWYKIDVKLIFLFSL